MNVKKLSSIWITADDLVHALNEFDAVHTKSSKTNRLKRQLVTGALIDFLKEQFGEDYLKD